MICIFFGIGAGLITNLIGVSYPLICSFAAMENKPAEQKKWLVYWVVFSVIILFEEYLEFIVYMIPFYYPMKASFLVYAMVPQFSGALVVYDLVKPYLSRLVVTDAVDDASASASASAKDE